MIATVVGPSARTASPRSPRSRRAQLSLADTVMAQSTRRSVDDDGGNAHIDLELRQKLKVRRSAVDAACGGGGAVVRVEEEASAIVAAPAGAAMMNGATTATGSEGGNVSGDQLGCR